MGDDAPGLSRCSFTGPSSEPAAATTASGCRTPSASSCGSCRLELLALLAADPSDPSLRRLRPVAYEDDPEAEDEFRRLQDGELAEERREALQLVAETAARDRLTAEELDAWLRALTDLRLAVGTRLDVTEDTYAQAIDPRDPQAYELSVFAYLSWLQEAAVEAAMEH